MATAFPIHPLSTLLFSSIISLSNTYSIAIGNTTIFVEMHHNVMSYLVILQIWRRTWSSTVEEKPNRCRECKKLFCVLDIWKLIYSFTVRRSLTRVASAKSHTERLRVGTSTYSITLERIHTAAQNAKRHSDRLEASAFICSFILERSCTHVDSVTNHSLKLKLWINICFFLWFVEVMVEVVLDEVTDEEVEDDIWWLVCPWSRCWTVKEVKGSDGLWRLAFGNVFICDFFKHYDFSPACVKCLA